MSRPDTNKPKISLHVIKRKGREFTGHAIFSVPWVSLIMMVSVSVISTIVLGLLAVILPLFIAHLTASGGSISEVLSFGVEFWLAAHGGTYYLQGLPLSLTPTGVSLIIMVILVISNLITARQASEQKLNKNPWVIVQVTATIQAIAYYLAVLFLAILYTNQGNWVRLSIGLAVISVFSAIIGAILGVKPKLPRIFIATVKGVVAGQLTLLFGAAILLLSSIISVSEQMTVLETKSGVTNLGSILLGFIYLAYLPTLLVWGESYLLGGGVQIGLDSFLAPGSSHGAVLPGIPIFAIVTDSTNPWNWLWLVVGLLSGIIAVLITLWSRKKYVSYRQLFWGIISLGLFILLTFGLFYASMGSLGLKRMAFIGPRIFEITIIGIFGLLIVGALTIIIFGYCWPPEVLEVNINNQISLEGIDTQVLWIPKVTQGNDKFFSNNEAEETTVMFVPDNVVEPGNIAEEKTQLVRQSASVTEDTEVLAEPLLEFYSSSKKIVDLDEDSLA